MPEHTDTSIPEILSEIGYVLTPDKDGWRTNSEYRGGTNKTALKIYQDGWVSDYVTGERFNLETLIKRTLNIDDQKAKEYLQGKHFDIRKIEYKEKPKVPEIFDESVLNGLIKDYTYFNQRNISNNVLDLFKCGVCLDSQNILGKYKNRFVFPIFNSSSKLIGFSARDLSGQSKAKWKTGGQKNEFCFPLIINRKIIQEQKSIYLFEGIPDILTAFEVGLRNCACTFGTEMGLGLLNVLIKLNPKKIYICLNSDGPGQEAAEKLKRRLYKYFNSKQIEIKYPPTCEGCKDLNDVLMLENGKNIILDWYKNKLNITTTIV